MNDGVIIKKSFVDVQLMQRTIQTGSRWSLHHRQHHKHGNL